jgi:hypothetical protein
MNFKPGFMAPGSGNEKLAFDMKSLYQLAHALERSGGSDLSKYIMANPTTSAAIGGGAAGGLAGLLGTPGEDEGRLTNALYGAGKGGLMGAGLGAAASHLNGEGPIMAGKIWNGIKNKGSQIGKGFEDWMASGHASQMPNHGMEINASAGHRKIAGLGMGTGIGAALGGAYGGLSDPGEGGSRLNRMLAGAGAGAAGGAAFDNRGDIQNKIMQLMSYLKGTKALPEHPQMNANNIEIPEIRQVIEEMANGAENGREPWLAGMQGSL